MKEKGGVQPPFLPLISFKNKNGIYL